MPGSSVVPINPVEWHNNSLPYVDSDLLNDFSESLKKLASVLNEHIIREWEANDWWTK